MSTRPPPSSMGEPIAVRAVTRDKGDEIYRPFLLTSLAMATFVGFVLAIHIPLQRLLKVGSSERSLDLIQAHGQVQLLGFAGLFVMGMSLRLLPRFAGSRIAFESLMRPVLVLIASSLLLRAVVMPWFSGSAHTAMLVASAFGLLVASGGFLWVTAGTLMLDARRFDASSLAFLLASVLLFAACALSTFAIVGDGSARDLAYLTDSAVVQLELLGFLGCFILGVALRAIPAMVGIERSGRSAGVVAVLLAGSAIGLASSLVYLQYVDFAKTVVRVADASFVLTGVALLLLAHLAGALRQAANRIRPASQTNLWPIRSAFVWMVIAAVIAIYTGVIGLRRGDLPAQLEFDAMRHALAVGVVTMLIVGMAMMILPEFAVGRQQKNRQAQLAVTLTVILNLSVLLRVLPSLAGDAWSYDTRNLSMAIAGSLAEVALLTFGVYFWRLQSKFG